MTEAGTSKSSRSETPAPLLPFSKVPKEKIGDKITALQQLVSTFGKTDTASVLLEAMEYIKFLSEQVNVLSIPVMKSGASMQLQQNPGKSKEDEGPKQDLKSKGLCLMPISNSLPTNLEVPKEKIGDKITALQQLVSTFGKNDTASVLLEAMEYIKFFREQVNVLSTPVMKSGASMQLQQVPKEKIGDKITALQQLVSTFGKNDTASVLLEAMEYIKFFREQVNVLSIPVMKSGASMQLQQNPGKSKEDEGPKQDLRSKGLCLMPISSFLPIDLEVSIEAINSAGPDIWIAQP